MSKGQARSGTGRIAHAMFMASSMRFDFGTPAKGFPVEDWTGNARADEAAKAAAQARAAPPGPAQARTGPRGPARARAGPQAPARA